MKDIACDTTPPKSLMHYSGQAPATDRAILANVGPAVSRLIDHKGLRLTESYFPERLMGDGQSLVRSGVYVRSQERNGPTLEPIPHFVRR
jgi:hypothetical protein